MDSCLVFLPDNLLKDFSCYLIGCIEFNENCNVFYVCDAVCFKNKSSVLNFNSIVGYYQFNKYDAPVIHKKLNWLTLWKDEEVEVKEILIEGNVVPFQSYRIFFYDHNTFLFSELMLDCKFDSHRETDYFKKLAYHVYNHHPSKKGQDSLNRSLRLFLNFFEYIFQICLTLLRSAIFLLKYSLFCVNFINFLEGLVWAIKSYKHETKLNLQTGNFIFSTLVDMILGSMFLGKITDMVDRGEIFNIISNWSQEVIHSIIITIEWLMGSPVGLKLNAPLNQIIGGFFLYNVNLWWTFLELVSPIMKYGFYVLLYFGVLGLTFQVAIILDLFSIATFHVYCIYVYAARLYDFQLEGLMSLSKLVLGKKRNPVPGRVDSCPYTTEQLFIGTTSFTVLLFLLPTVLVYYVVFAFMRLGVVLLCAVMNFLIYYLRIAPFYTVYIWIFDPHRITMNVSVSLQRRRCPVKWSVQAVVKSWSETVKVCLPSVVTKPVPFPWADIIKRLTTGKLIYPIY